MLDWTLRTLRACREMRDLAWQALGAYEDANQAAIGIIKTQMQRLVAGLARDLPGDFPASRIGDLRRHIGFSHLGDYQEILRFDLPDVEEKIEIYASRGVAPIAALGFEDLMHPLVREASIRHYQAGDFRNAVLDAITAVFDKIRERTGVDADGDSLARQVFSADQPLLILSELDTQSGRNDQTGFMDIFRGFYRGVRNPKAHSLVHDLNAEKAGQYLVLASLLMRRVMEARPANVAAA